ncbi:endonuclease domain-containing protein [Nonomuraea roseola]|uniref:Endonuclease domain-containing protein n=1 Tax=Nonomuraea roseola TaxID=46179 RepID=A0ABV5PX20_9ACTN
MSPVVLTHAATAPRRMSDLVAAVLRDMEDLAVRRFPQWLPGAEQISGPGGAGVRAVRMLAVRLAAGDRHFGPFLADLAEAALRGRPCTARLPAEVRAAGLGRVLGTGSTIAVTPPRGMSASEAEVLAAGCRWLERWSGLHVLCRLQEPPPAPPNPPAARPEPPAARPEPRAARPGLPVALLRPSPACPEPPVVSPGTRVALPGASPALPEARVGRGRPHHASRAEQRLESVLAACAWAVDREWNQGYHAHPLTNPIRPDLLWREARVIVEIDDDSHLRPEKFAADRQRDVRLQRDGFVVLRFTSHAVLSDPWSVAREIEDFVKRGKR